MDQTENRKSEIENRKWLNELPLDQAVQQLIQCCGSTNWAKTVAARRPYKDLEEVMQTAEEVWWQLDAADWLEAFKAHPKIGEKKAATAGTERTEAWSTSEQGGMNSASEHTSAQLAKLNREYEEKFGYIFIVCASGKSSDEMLTLLKERLPNEPNQELRIAASEQAKITQLRLTKLFSASLR
jgi:OHCU decarboxylase